MCAISLNLFFIIVKLLHIGMTIGRELNVSFVCDSGHILDNLSAVCDGRVDCHDGSDETSLICSRTVCPINHIKCYYGACINRSEKCDGIRNCADGSDERNCGRNSNSCGENEFYCANTFMPMTQCIPMKYLCDEVRHCVDGSDESISLCGPQLCPFGTFRCRYGGCIPIEAQCDGFRDCLDGSDETEVLCLSLNCSKCLGMIKCSSLVGPDLQSSRIEMNCQWSGRPVSCLNHILPGTRVSYKCKEHFFPATTFDANNNWNFCQADGTWLRDSLQCIPECGRTSAIIPLVMNGWGLARSLPWHASLFIREDDKQKPYYVCGATLISEAIVVTAAHCIFDAQANQLIVVLGATSTQYKTNDSLQQQFNAKRIILHPLYLDRLGNYGSDIALIEFDGTLQLSDFMLPICIDWTMSDSSSYLINSTVGIAVGLGLTEDLNYSEKLRVTTVPIIDSHQCSASQTDDFRKYLTFTSFCGGWANGTSVCNGDSGAGLIFPMDNQPNRWCLQGIVSLSPRKLSSPYCDPYQYAIFTKVSVYLKWMQQSMKEIHSKHIDENIPYRDERPVL